jgi:hypothetical protein
MAVTGITGGIIGSFIGGPAWIAGVGLFGAALGAIVWRLGGQRFFLCIVIGATLGGLLATYLNGTESALLGAAAGGAMGGFLGVNISMIASKRS